MSFEASNRRALAGNPIGTGLRLAAAVAVLVGGLVHLQLYFDGYRDFPNDNLGRSFLLNAVASAIVAAALIVRKDVIVRLAGIGLVAGTLVAFWMSRRGDGIFGLREEGFNPSPQAGLALVVELFALVALAATFVPALGAGGTLERAVAIPAVAAVLVATLAGGVLWAQGESGGVTATTDAPASDVVEVSIANFDFQPAEVEVAVGTTIRWTNNDSFDHIVSSSDGTFESETLGAGDTFEFTFSQAGTFDYVCSIHPEMAGTVTVTA